MDRTCRRPLRALVAGLVIGAACATGTAAAAGAGAAPALDWTDCGEGFLCATAQVPRDHFRPAAGTVDIALVKKPATGAKRLGTLFTNPGGPGSSGTEFVRAAAPIFASVNDRFDLVGWDPRGTGGSGSISCLTPAQREARWPVTDPFPTLRTLGPTAAQAKEFAAGCLAADTEGTLAGLTTENAARDLDLLRRAVGDPKLNYLGFSYGTYLGAMYTTLFPGRSRALVLDGAIDPVQYTNDPLGNLVEQSFGFEDGVERFFGWCATSPVCAFQGGRPAFDALLASLAKHPLPATASGDPRVARQADLQNALTAALYTRQVWPVAAAVLTEAQGGDGSSVLAVSDGFRGRIDAETYAPDLDGFAQTSCADLSYPRTAKGFAAYERRAAKGRFIGLNNLYGEFAPGYVCAVWPARGSQQYTGPFVHRAAKGGAPALVIGTTHDPATPYRWAGTLTRQLGRARLLTMDGDGHTAFGGNSACIDIAVEAYFERLALPPANTVCRQEVIDTAPEAATPDGAPAAAALVRGVRFALRGR